jgi:hypothetical protein
MVSSGACAPPSHMHVHGNTLFSPYLMTVSIIFDWSYMFGFPYILDSRLFQWMAHMREALTVYNSDIPFSRYLVTGMIVTNLRRQSRRKGSTREVGRCILHLALPRKTSNHMRWNTPHGRAHVTKLSKAARRFITLLCYFMTGMIVTNLRRQSKRRGEPK